MSNAFEEAKKFEPNKAKELTREEHMTLHFWPENSDLRIQNFRLEKECNRYKRERNTAKSFAALEFGMILGLIVILLVNTITK